MPSSVPAKPVLNVNDPLCFFTTVADKMLRNTFSFGVTNIPVYVNGQFVYTPAVNRVLQLAANIYDASTNSFYPDVFRPIFEHDNLGNVFIVSYTNLSSASGPNTVSGETDQQLSSPWDVTTLTNLGPSYIPITSNNGYVNVYGVPWIIGAKKYLPGFNQFSLINSVQVNRLLQIARAPEADGSWSPVWTNHMYLLSISNLMSASFWNPYSNNYPTNYPGGLNLSAYISDTVEMVMTNSDHPGIPAVVLFTTNFVFSPAVWPGSQWAVESSGAPAIDSFIANNWTNTFISQEIYKTGARVFALPTDPDPWETNNHSCDPLPQFGLMTTNWLRAVILDDNHVIDYVQLRGPTDGTNFTAALNDPNAEFGQIYLWATNAYGNGPLPSWGYVNQIDVSMGFAAAPPSAAWNNPSTPSIPGMSSVAAAQAYLASMLTPSSSFIFNGITYTNNEPAVQAGYTATRSVFVPYLYQVNDPLVHYLVSDLNAGSGAVWGGGAGMMNGVWVQNNGVAAFPTPVPPMGVDIIKGRYQPWGKTAPPALQSTNYNLDDAYNLIYKDPLVWSPDYWDFPTNLLSDLTGLGQVHRGTPWQTIYLKADDVLQILNAVGNVSSGTNTWVEWTGDGNIPDAAIMAPANDRQLASLLISLLNTNDPTQLMSVNDPNIADWLNVLNGLKVYSNSLSLPTFTLPANFRISPTFDTFVMAGNSPQAEMIATNIAQARAAQPNGNFYTVGDILSAPELTENSPWLNTTSANQMEFGISDAVYEAIPAQLLLLLRPGSIGAVSLTNGVMNLQFSGSDAFSYELQESTDLVNWIPISTNSPVQGSFNVSLPSTPNSPETFYRSVLLP